MPRDIGAQVNVFEVVDGLSGDIHEMFAGQPTNKERAAYNAALFRRKGKKVIDQSFSTRLRFGKRLCTGFTKGSFVSNGTPFSSDKSDADYRHDWKELLEQGAADVFVALAFQLFEGTGRTGSEMDFEEIDIDVQDEESADPLGNG